MYLISCHSRNSTPKGFSSQIGFQIHHCHQYTNLSLNNLHILVPTYSATNTCYRPNGKVQMYQNSKGLPIQNMCTKFFLSSDSERWRHRHRQSYLFKVRWVFHSTLQKVFRVQANPTMLYKLCSLMVWQTRSSLWL